MKQELSHFMKSVHKSVLIWYSAAQMCELVADVDKYPEFLPWCTYAKQLPPDADGSYVAEIGMGFAGMKQMFATRNVLVPAASLSMRLTEGPFSNLEGDWVFTPVEGDPGACRVTLDLHYAFNPLLSAIVGPVFDKIANTMVDSFITRAEQVYGT